MLSIVATLKEFQGMLPGVNIHVFMDHKNLMFDTLKMQCMLRWRTKIEEFLPVLHYIEGPCNILANNLSRLHRLDSYTGSDRGGEETCRAQRGFY